MQISELKVGDILNNNQIMEVFGVGNSGGMRRSHSTNSLVLISDPFKATYEDRWEDDILHYTGMGLEGYQTLSSQNKTLMESKTSDITVHLFEVMTPKEYTYLGVVELYQEPYQEKQDGRNVWMFPLKTKANTAISVRIEDLKKKYEDKEKRAKQSTDEELLNRLKNGNKKPSRRRTTTTSYERNPDVVEYAKRKAKGICALCEQPAPFNTKDSEPYLEVHHIEWLSRGGEDNIQNVVAICPNCHRRMHALDIEEEVKKLQAKA